MLSKGFVAVVNSPIEKEDVVSYLASWIDRFEKVEQVAPDTGASMCAVGITKPDEILWEPNMQFRVTNGEEFAWVYLSLHQRVIETTGLPSEEISLCLDVLLELDGVTEVIDEHNDRRLDELEAEGLM
jgi:hypothetical protein